MGDCLQCRNAILHILDDTSGFPMLSEQYLDLAEIGEYVQKHITRALKDAEIKAIDYPAREEKLTSAIYEFAAGQFSLKEVSVILAELFYAMIHQYDIPAADLLVVDYVIDGEPHLIAMKMNYKRSYIHYVENDGGIANRILCQSAALPAETQKIDEFVDFSLRAGVAYVKEKKYSLDGVTQAYIAKFILKTDEIPSPKEQLHTVRKTMAAVAEKYYPDDFAVKAGAEKAICDSFESEGILDIAAVAENVSKGVASIKEEFFQEVKARGIETAKVSLNENLRASVNKKQRIVTEDGLELKLPPGLLEQKDKFEIINNPDGTLSILIKNIEII